MSTPKYIPVALEGEAAKDDTRPDVHLEALGVKMDLPNLGGPRVPLEIVTAYAAAQQNTDQQAANISVVSAFIDYFHIAQPQFWQKVRATPDGTAWMMSVIKAWGEASGLDPKPSA